MIFWALDSFLFIFARNQRDDRKDLLRAARFLADKAATGELRALNSANKKSGPSQGEEDVPGATAPALPFAFAFR